MHFFNKLKIFNTFHLKIIALITMTLDHIASFIPHSPIWFHYFGRLSAPLFVFCFAHGLDYTHSRFNYLKRLYYYSILQEFLWMLCTRFYPSTNSHMHYNFFATLFIIGILIHSFEIISDRSVLLKKILLWQTLSTLLCILSEFLPYPINSPHLWATLTGNILYCEGGLFWCVLGVLIYHSKNNLTQLVITYTSCCLYYEFVSATAIYARLAYFSNYHLGIVGNIFSFLCFIMTGTHYAFTPITLHGLYWGDYQWIMIGALPIMLLYNNKRGTSLKHTFYIYYPLHLIVLNLVAHFLYIKNI